MRFNVHARNIQLQTKFGPVRLCFGQIKVTTMCARQFACNAQPETVPRRLFVASCPIETFENLWRAFRWNVLSIDGHDYQQIGDAFDQARHTKGKPTFVIAETTKGKGVSFMEGKIGWHGMAPNKEQLEQAVAELRAAKEKLSAELAQSGEVQ